MSKKDKSLGDLEKGIKQLLRENRCSFSEEERALLEKCLELIRNTRKDRSIDDIVKILKVAGRFIISSDLFDDIF